MKIINKSFDQERALYGENNIELFNVSFDGKLDGESAVKECKNVKVNNCFCNLRYPFWHDTNLIINNTKMTEKCRAALWYSNGIVISKSEMLGIKALRECKNIEINNCKVVSPEFGWFNKNVIINSCEINSEYCMLRSKDLKFDNVNFSGKYSFQYVKNSVFDNCVFDTKDAFWHGENIVIRNSVVKGEYLAWYSKNITFENCIITGTQPLCYCKNLKLINCEMHQTDLSFEKSEVVAEITTLIDSVKNPYKGKIIAPKIGEIIITDSKAKCEIKIEDKNDERYN